MVATRVLDVVRLGTEEEDAGETVEDGNKRHQQASLKVMDDLALLKKKYQGENHDWSTLTKHFIGLTHNVSLITIVICQRKNPYAPRVQSPGRCANKHLNNSG